jgi:hypothetical protein
MTKTEYLTLAKACAAAIDQNILATAREKCRNGAKCNRIENRNLAIEADRLQNLSMAAWVK